MGSPSIKETSIILQWTLFAFILAEPAVLVLAAETLNVNFQLKENGSNNFMLGLLLMAICYFTNTHISAHAHTMSDLIMQ